MLRPMNVGGLRVLRPAALAAVLGACAIAIPHADAAGRTKLHPPTLLWKAYPLVQQARAPEARTTASERREAMGPTMAQGRWLSSPGLGRTNAARTGTTPSKQAARAPGGVATPAAPARGHSGRRGHA